MNFGDSGSKLPTNESKRSTFQNVDLLERNRPLLMVLLPVGYTA